MIATMLLSEEIASEAADLREAYPKGATPHDLAGWFGQPLQRIEAALASMRAEGLDVAFVRQETEKNPAAVLMGKAGGKARAEKMTSRRRSEIAANAAASRWSKGHLDHPNRKAMTDPQKRALVMLERAAELAAKYPFGATHPDLVEFFGFANTHTYEAARALEAMGDAVWEKDGDVATHSGKFKLYVRGMKRMPAELTDRQMQVYLAIVQRRNKSGIATVNYTEIGREISGDSAIIAGGTTIMTVCNSLERKGYIKRITPWEGAKSGKSPEYEVYDPIPQEPNLDKEPKRIATITTPAEWRPKFGDDERIAKAKARLLELRTEVTKVEAFLEIYGELEDED